MVGLTAAVACTKKQQKEAQDLEKKIKEQGWAIVNLKKETIKLDPIVDRFPSYGQLKFMRDDTPSSIFKSFITDSLIDVVLRCRKND